MRRCVLCAIAVVLTGYAGIVVLTAGYIGWEMRAFARRPLAGNVAEWDTISREQARTGDGS